MEQIDILLGKYFAGECTGEDRTALKQWLQQSDENRRYFEQMERVWNTAWQGREPIDQAIDVEKALARTKAIIRENEHNTVLMRPSKNTRQWWWAAAAAVAVLVAVVQLLRNPILEKPETLVLNASEAIRTDTLPDQSVIGLNRSSRLEAAYTPKQRKVKLEGEAFFEVAPMAEKPFVIDVKTVEITVVGTKFNVDNLSNPDEVLVQVTEGKVKVAGGEQAVFLVQGEQAVYNILTGTLKKTELSTAQNVKSWWDKKFIFDDVPIQNAIASLEKAYGTQIIFKNKALLDCRLYAIYDNQPLERIMEILQDTYPNWTIAKNTDGYIIDGSGCEE